MEALPTMPMMAPQFRTSTLSYDNIPNFDFRLRMKEHILLTFNADPHEYDSAFDELAQMKFEANIPSASVEQILKLKRYYGQLCMMQKRFPMAAGEQLETPFAWHDGLVDMRSAQSEVTICDIEFEKASVMFNIGACHAQYAAEQPRDTPDSIKTAFSHFQQAATAFEQLNTYRNSDFFYPSVDLDANVITFYYNVCVAQAQECIVQKSLLENRNPLVTAKLALWLMESYEATNKIVEDWSVNIPESVQRYYARLCRLKSSMYAVIGFMAMGDHYEKEDKKMGWRLQYYNIANKFMESLTENHSKMRERYPELYVTSSFLFDVISAKQKNAEKENNFIYHDRVPSHEDAFDAAHKEGSVCKVTVPKFNPLDPSVCGADLFEKLLPSFVQEANNKYQEKKDEIYREMKDIVKSYNDHLNYQLELAGFDQLQYMLNEGKNREAWFQIPEDLMQRNADMTSYPDCVPNLIEKMRESSDTARVAEAKLNTLLAKLRAIDLPRLKADEGFNLIQKELERLSEHLEQAKANNVSLNKAIVQHSANLQILTLPCAEMWQKIVPMEEENSKSSTSQSPEEIQLRKMVAKVEEMKKQRNTFMDELAAELKADDIATKLMGTNERGAEEIMNAEIAKHATRQSAIRLNVTAQEAILRAFADANADFHEERSGMSKMKQEYEKRVNELCASYEVYRDVARKCEEGEQFYRQLMARCDQFAIPVHAMEEQYREELEKKERAKKEAEQHLNQIRMSREAQSALMDFGGAPRSPAGAPGSMMGPPGQHYIPPTSSGARGGGPRLGDYLDSYRARKQKPQVQIPQEPPQGPPSPTPSSICDFPVSSSRSQRFGPTYPPSQASPVSSQYGGGPPMPSGPYGAPQAPQGYPGPQYQPTPYQAPAPLTPGTPAFQQASTPYSGEPPSSYSVPRVVPGYTPGPGSQHSQYAPSSVQGGPGGPGYGGPPAQGAQGYGPAAPSQNQGYGGPPGGPQHHQQYNPSPVPQGPPQYQPPPQHHGYNNPPGAPHGYQNPSYNPLPVQGEAVQGAPGSQAQYVAPYQAPYQAPAAAQPQHYTPSPVSGGPGGPGGPYQAPGVQGYPAPGGHTQLPPRQEYAPAPIQPASNQYAPVQNGPNQAAFNPPPPSQYAPSSVQNGPSQAAFNGPPQPPAQGSLSQSQGYGPIPQQQPSYQPVAPPAQPIFQHPPQGVPISAPPPSSHHQHVAPTPQPPPAAQQAPPAASVAPAPSRFTPTPGAPSPWHATPAELKTPWMTTPQYHAPPTSTSTPAAAPAASGAGQGFQTTSSTVDLLSDLLGDFNLAPPIQPTMQNTQHLQQSQQHPAPPAFNTRPPASQQQAPPTTTSSQPINNHQDFCIVTSNQPDPPPPQVSKQPYVRPAAAVQPMPHYQPQPTPELSQIAQQATQNCAETPILGKGSPSITELSDPSKFQLGEGDRQKLEKRLLHQSFRTNGPPPPLNQSDPLNQIDAFSFASRK